MSNADRLALAREDEHVEISINCTWVHECARGLQVSVELDDDLYVVWGPELHLFLTRLDPDVWSPECAVGEA